HNPMQMGCGPMIFQMVFLMGIVGIIYYPLSYVMGINSIADYTEELTTLLTETGYSGRYLQLGILENWSVLRDSVAAQLPDVFTADNIAQIDAFRSGLYIGSLDMSAIPHWKDGIIVIIPILSFLTSLGSTIVSTLIQKKNNPAAAQQMSQMMMMMLMMPIFSLVIAFQVPAAVGFYWIISNVIAILQQLFIAKFFPPKKSQAKLMVENTIYRRSKEENFKKIK
ncbi:MAG: YidC/Oxa1 family membrane protein insertase, partial [Eubacterium sp.]|nr:YidC/Oxa1 family membrane protein insertase [Eubacterium sp.]